LRENPEYGARFNEAMVGMYGAVGQAVIAVYDFSCFASIVDLGGGTNRLLAAILQFNEHLRGALFELPEIASEARRFCEASTLAARCEIIEGDFFTSVPSRLTPTSSRTSCMIGPTNSRYRSCAIAGPRSRRTADS
jgi:hypothetical protein